jgi:hypothetical protein
MHSLFIEQIQKYRTITFHMLPGERLSNVDEAVAFVNQRGFTFFWPISGIILPSLWAAVAGDRPVADAHDDPGHVTWGWKDELLGKKRWFYAKVLRKKATMISLEILPYFYALSENYGSFEDDYLTQYEQGRLTQEAKIIYETLLSEGPLDTVALRRATHLTSRESDYRFNRGLTELQVDFKVLPVGVAQAGAWNYAFIYDIVPRHFPELPDQAHYIQETEARCKLAEVYFHSVGAAQLRDLIKLFGWRPVQAERAVNQLMQGGILVGDLELDKNPGKWLALRALVGQEEPER